MKKDVTNKLHDYEIIDEGLEVNSGNYIDPTIKDRRVSKLFYWLKFNFTFRHKIIKDFIFYAHYSEPIKNKDNVFSLCYNHDIVNFAFFDVNNRKWNSAIFKDNYGMVIQGISPIELTDIYNNKCKEIFQKHKKNIDSKFVKDKANKYIKQFVLNCLLKEGIFEYFEKLCLIDVRMKEIKK